LAREFRCTLISPEAQLLDEQAVYANVPAWDGQVGFAPDHAAALFKLGPGLLRLDLTNNRRRWLYLGGGFGQMSNNQLTLLCEDAVQPKELDLNDLQRQLQEAKQAQAQTLEEQRAKRERIERLEDLIELAKLGK
jgi:F-type H+-transporting ATPase subunit epsilon